MSETNVQQELSTLRKELEELKEREYGCENELVRVYLKILDEISELKRRVEALERKSS